LTGAKAGAPHQMLDDVLAVSNTIAIEGLVSRLLHVRLPSGGSYASRQ
jgi:hypothetical protein